MKYIYASVMAFFLYIFEHSILIYSADIIPIPDMALFLLLAFIFLGWSDSLPALGFCVGLILDFLTGYWLGYNMLSLCLIGLFIYLVKKKIYLERPIVIALLTLGASLIREGLVIAFYSLEYGGANIGSIVQSSLSVVAYTMILLLIICGAYQFVKILWKSLELS